MANKKSKTYNKEAFETALNTLTKELALQILKDGEGSSKVVAFEVKGATCKNLIFNVTNFFLLLIPVVSAIQLANFLVALSI